MILGSVAGAGRGAHGMKHAALTQAAISPSLAVATSDAPGNHAAYEEYLRGFDDIPVLQDAVRIPPPRRQPPDFRRGERRDVRQEPRPDGYTLREQTFAEIEFLYQEYTRPPVAARRPSRKKKPQARNSKQRPTRKTKKRSASTTD